MRIFKAKEKEDNLYNYPFCDTLSVGNRIAPAEQARF